jgi:thiol reductant ABC exporter CydC subunit
MADSALKTLRRLLGYMLPLWRGVALSVLLGLLTIASSIGLMATSAWLISKASLQPSIAALGVSVVAVRFFGIARGVFRYLERLVSHDTTFRLLAEWRVRFYRAIEPLAPAGLTDARSGDLLARVVGDVDALQYVYLRAIAPLLVAFFTALLVTLLFGAFDPLVALVMLAFLCLGGAGLPLFAWWRSQGIGAALIADRAALHAALVDQIQGMADSLVYGKGQAQLNTLDELSHTCATRERRFSQWDALQNALGILIVNGAALAVLATAIPRVDGIYLATLALAAYTAFEAITPLAQAATNLGTGLAAAQRLFDIVDQKPAVLESTSAVIAQDYSITFEHVTFRYNSEAQPALNDLSLSVQSGQRVAIVGESGAGKSSLVNVLLRFWEYETGEIRLGEHNLREYAPTDLREMIGVMTQRTYLFTTSVLENIRLAHPTATDAEVMQAAERAQAHDFITALPQGYATDVGEDGARLSGGERQRIALARVLLKNAPILILDEPTANLDALTERSVWESIFATTAGKTLLVVSHRLPDAPGATFQRQLRLAL